MAKKINIAELAIDEKALLKSTQAIKKEIDSLKASQKELTKSGQTSSKAFIQNAVDLKTLSKAYGANVKAIAENTQATKDAANRSEELEIALSVEAETIDSLRAQNKLLNKLRNSANILTEEGAEELKKLNAKLDENNEKIKENVDAFTQQKINIGNYKESITEALGELSLFNGGLTGFLARSKEAGGVGKLVGSSLKQVAIGFRGMTKAALGFIATPIGAILAALVLTFGLVRNALSRSEESTNKLKKAFAPLTGLFKKFLAVLEPVGDFLIDGIVKGFELAEKAILKGIRIISSGLRLLGLDSAADSMKNFADEIEEVANKSRELADAEALLRKETRKLGVIQKEALRNAEKQRQIRDDESRSIKDRIKANTDLGKVLQTQSQDEIRIANQSLALTDLRIQQEGETTELLDERAEKLNEIADINERITGQESEQLVNLISLRRESSEQIKAAFEKKVEQSSLELELLKEQNRFAAENSKEQLELDKQFADKEIENLKFKLDKKLISQTQFNLESLQIQNDLKEKQNELDDQELDRIQAFEDKKKELIDNIRILNEEDDQAREEIKIELQFEKDTADIEKLIEDETQRTELLALLTEERELVLQGIKDKFAETSLKAFQDTLNKENQAQLKGGQAQINTARVVASALIGILGDSLGARLAAIAIDAAIQVGLLQGSVAAASARNLAQATAAAPPPLNAALIAVALGQNAVLQTNAQVQTAKILTSAAIGGLGATISKVKFEQGGIASVDGPSHSGGGVPIFAGNKFIGEAEGGEGIGILRRSAFADFMSYNDSFSGGISAGGNYQGGGIISQTVRPTDNAQIIVDGISQALSEIPPAIVTVEDIDRGFQDKILVESGANS